MISNVEEAKKIAQKFNIKGEICDCTIYGNGHINNTYLIVADDGIGKVRYILQSVNGQVFRKPKEVMKNILNVTSFLKEKTSNPESIMVLIKTFEGKPYYFDEDGVCWRIYTFIENSVCLEAVESPEDFYQIALAFGQFQNQLNDFPVNKLYETIPNFHNTPKRYEDFLEAIDNDTCDRVKKVSSEIEFVKARRDFMDVLYNANREGKLPFRVTHNDTKINNVMLNVDTRRPLCVIDLDTIMPGFSVTDFGDSIRFGASTAAEDEKDLSKVWLDLELFEAFTKGFLEGCGGLLSEEEIMLMPEGAKMMTLECGMRFLGDYLNGDVYFKTEYPEHNLDRAHTQFKLVEDMENHWNEMKAIMKKYI